MRVNDICAHCYCASLVRTLFISHMHATSCISSAHTELNIFVGCSVTPIFFGRSLPFLIRSIILKNKKKLHKGSFSYFSYTIQIGLNWYMDTGVCDLEVAFCTLILPHLMTYVAKIY